MKVRHKRTGDVLDLDALLGPLINEHYEIIADAPSEPRWQDVTGECKLPYNFATSSDLGCMIVLKEDTWPLWGIKVPTDGIYRLRKVMLSPQHGVPAWQWAFLVERKVE